MKDTVLKGKEKTLTQIKFGLKELVEEGLINETTNTKGEKSYNITSAGRERVEQMTKRLVK